MSDRKKRGDEFHELLGAYYGNGRSATHHPAGNRWLAHSAGELLEAYYGGRPRRHAARRDTPLSLASSHDDGETLQTGSSAQASEEYAVARPLGEAGGTEYVVERIPAADGTATGLSLSEAPVDPRNEYQVDLLDPLAAGPNGQSAAPAAAPTPAVPTPAAPIAVAAAPIAVAAAPIAVPASASVTAPSTRTTNSPQTITPSHDDFLADMKSILSGKGVYDPVAKQTVSKDAAAAKTAATPKPAAPPATSQAQEIFDKLAASMQYANAYDLGTVELENRFADFDMLDDAARNAQAGKKQRRSAPGSEPRPQVGAEEFIEDLDAIHRDRDRDRDADRPAGPRPGVAEAASIDPRLSRFMFDTGEHVLFGGNAYVDQLHVGAAPGVAFSYGQLIAMGDLFESVDQMMSADANQLARIKALIERSTAYYAGHKADPAKDVSDDEWDAVTGHRYLQLAEMNFEHFSPNFLFRGGSFASLVAVHGNNKSAWEQYHARAIKEAQAVGLALPTDKSLLLPLEGALITNAFGDHFLTDAFSAGHLINKEAITELWKANFFSSGSLTSDAKAFFQRVAAKAFANPKVRKAFSSLETVKSYYLVVHPSIDTAERFGSVLESIAQKEPERIANMCVKAIHDRFNSDGVEVTNDAGDGTWTLKGDAHLDDRNRRIIQRAVEQSIANINDPSILVSNIDMQSYFAKVWKHVPKLSPASQANMKRIINDYVTPASTVLADAASAIIEGKVDLLVKELIAAKALKRT